MTDRELVVLGTSSLAPTRYRNHNGYLLRWDREGILFDPGEGTQRQLIFAGVPVSAVTRICITHFHGDHSLGLAGVLQRRSMDRLPFPVHIYYPASGQEYFDRLRYASAYFEASEVRAHPVSEDGPVAELADGTRLVAMHLDHRIETLGWRLEEPDGRRMLPDRLTALGISGPDVGRLLQEGHIEVNGRSVSVGEVSAPRPGQSAAFVMDTRACPAAAALAAGVDLLVCEATFLHHDLALAEQYAHLTARQAAELARDAAVRRLVITHFSQRYDDSAAEHLAEAAEVFPDVVAVRDLDRVAVPRRR